MATKNEKSSKQIKITLTKENYNKLKEAAEKNYRTLSQEVNYRLHQLLSRPGNLDTPASSPIYFPPGVREPLPSTFIPHNTPGGIRTILNPENPDRETNRDQRYV